MRPTRFLAFATIVAFLASTTTVASDDSVPFDVGDRLPQITLEDQHDERGTIDETTRIILFSRDMDGGKLLRDALEDAPEGYLEKIDAVYVSDISGMPSLVATLFAVPSMRRRAYPMLLDRNGEATARLPDVEDKATLIFISELAIERVDHADDAEAVQRLLGLPPTTDPDSDSDEG